MSFPRYPKYKDSGVEWLGDVPEHWEVAPMIGIVAERDEPNRGMVEDNLLSLSYGRIVCKDISSNDGLLPESFETYQIVRPGDVVFRLTDLQNDKRSLRTALVEEVGIITSAYVAVTPMNANPRFLGYLFRAYDTSKVFYSMGGGLRQSMKFNDLKRMPILVPTPDEQKAVATFLDRETAQIDALIAEQERLIELLKEKRQAVISHAVTKGLNPDAPMKDSGVEWLGEVPEHWEVGKLWTLFDLVTRSPHEDDEIVTAFRDGQVTLRANRREDGFTNALKEHGYQRVEPGDLVIHAMDAFAGAIGVSDSAGKSTPVYSVCVPRRTGVEPKYFAAVLRHLALTGFIASLAKGVRERSTDFRWREASQTLLPIPDESEQRAIASFLDRETARIDALIAEQEQLIELLNERRSALISAAVTGQIDVRHLATAEAA